MYIGSTGQRGLHHLVYEVLDNAIDEVQAGHAAHIEVDMDLGSGWVTISDDGRGIPTGLHPRTGKSALETVLTVLHAGGKFGGDSSGYKVSGGLHGVGISVVNALSEQLEVKVWRAGRMYQQRYSRGAPLSPLQESAAEGEEAEKKGTQVRFLYDPTIFSSSATFDPDIIRSRLRELAFLNSGATIRFRAHKGGQDLPGAPSSSGGSSAAPPVKGRGPKSGAAAAGGLGPGASSGSWQVFHYQGGIREYVLWLNEGKEALCEPVFFTRSAEGVTVEVALQWCADSFNDTLIGFANSIRTVDGGTHLEGLRAALTRTLNSIVKRQKLMKEGEGSLAGEHIREGLSGIVSVKVPNPEFEGQTKTRLGNPEVRKIVDSAVAEELGVWLETHPQALSAILAKALQAAKAAEAAKKARELVRRKSVLTRTTLPGKLADCTSTVRAETEIFLVEGDSAGGSAKQARDRRTQAILPLRGKILNVERKDDASLLKNNEIANIIVALGLASKGEDLSSLRYGRIIILTDADVDGAHIRTLLLTFLFRYRRDIFEKGHVYVAVPPLYKVELTSAGVAAVAARASAAASTSSAPGSSSGGKVAGSGGGKRGGGPAVRWCFSDAELRGVVSGLPAGSFSVQRFKGLGEMMPEQLWETTLNPATRQLRRLTIEDAAAAAHMFTVLMGDKVAPRRALIESEGAKYRLEDLDV